MKLTSMRNDDNYENFLSVIKSAVGLIILFLATLIYSFTQMSIGWGIRQFFLSRKSFFIAHKMSAFWNKFQSIDLGKMKYLSLCAFNAFLVFPFFVRTDGNKIKSHFWYVFFCKHSTFMYCGHLSS